MQAETHQVSISKARLWTGRVISVVPALMLMLDAVMKLVKPDFVGKSAVEIGYSESVMLPLGVVLFISVILYMIPRTAVLGAVMLTGYIGAAGATNVWHQDGRFTILFPATFGAVL